MKRKHEVSLGISPKTGFYLYILCGVAALLFLVGSIIYYVDSSSIFAALVVAAFFFFAAAHTNRENYTKISVIENQVIVDYHAGYQKNKLVFEKTDIKNFNVRIRASMLGDFGDKGRQVWYDINIDITTVDDKHHKLPDTLTTSSRAVIKNLFKTAKYIPNFTYSANSSNLPAAVEDINKMARCGRGLNIFEYLKFMLTNQKVSRAGRIETIFWLVLGALLIGGIVVAILDIKITGIASWVIFAIFACFIAAIYFILIVGTFKQSKTYIDERERENYHKFLNKYNYNDWDINMDNIKQKQAEELALCELFIQQNPKNFYAIERRASLYLYVENYEKAMKEYQLLLEKNPDKKEYILGFAECHLGLKNFEMAEEIVEQYYEKNEKDYKYYGIMEQICIFSNNMDLAQEYGKKHKELLNKELTS